MEFRDFWWKLAHVFVPFLLAAVAFPVVYAAMEWLLLDQIGVNLDKELVELWAPLGLGALIVWLAVYPGLRLLAIGERLITFYVLIALAGLVVPTFFARDIMMDLTSRLEHVSDLADVAADKPANYYSADHVCFDHQASQVFATLGRDSHDHPTSFKIFIATPVCSMVGKPADAPVWIGLEYKKFIERASTDAELDAEYQPFARETDEVFAKENGADFRYFERIRLSDDLRNFRKAIAKSGRAAEDVILLVPHRESFVHDVTADLGRYILGVVVGCLVWLVLSLLPEIDEDKRDEAARKKAGAVQTEPGIGAALLIPSASNYGAPLLFDVNIAVYLAMVLSGLGVMSFDTADLIAWGGNYGPLDHGLGVLRLISCQFVHGGLMHLGNNLYGLLFATLFLSPVISNWRLIACYLVCGLGGSITSLLVHPDIVSIGASGAIMGLWGALLVLSLLRDARMGDARKGILINVAMFTGLTLFLGSVVPGIDNAAHIGGLVTGGVLGLVLLKRSKT